MHEQKTAKQKYSFIDDTTLEKLLKDIRKGQSIKMLCYIYKLPDYKIRFIAEQNLLTVYDPEDSISDRDFMRGGISVRGDRMFNFAGLASQW